VAALATKHILGPECAPRPRLLWQNSLSTKSKARKQRIVLPEGEDWRVVAAAGELLARDLCEFVILGVPEQVSSAAAAAVAATRGL
jgi:phosphotransacetylase